MLKKYEAVCYEYLRPEEVKALREKCPVVYIVAGSLEWHGFQNPLGCDSLKAHAICCEAALRYGGVVLPTIYQGHMTFDKEPDRNWGPDGWEGYTVGYQKLETLETIVTDTARALVAAGWKVIVGVTGHDITPQRDALKRGIESAIEGTSCAGFAVKEGELHTPDDEIPLKMDHGAAWETSCMMYACPGRVDMDALRSRGLGPDDDVQIRDKFGMGGVNPLKQASAEMGRKIIERMAELIGTKALTALPPSA